MITALYYSANTFKTYGLNMELSDLINELTELREDLIKLDRYPKEGLEVMMECAYAEGPELVGCISVTRYIDSKDGLRVLHPSDRNEYSDAKPCVILW